MSDTEDKHRFVVDAMLGRLAKSLRMLGYDAVYRADIEDSEIKMIALRERRTILTRDHQLAEAGPGLEVVLVESDHVEEQLVQVADQLVLMPPPGLFTRCLVCNTRVIDVDRNDVVDLVPSYVHATQERFVRCPDCGRIYWPATHVERATDWLRGIFGGEQVVRHGPPAPDSGGRSDNGNRRTQVADRKTNIFVTGRPGVGKTTLIMRVLDLLDMDAGGFYTEEVREGGSRVGFSIVGLNGERGVLARVDLDSPFRVGRYGVNRDDLERVGVSALEDAVARAPLVVMDEIGRMELCSPAFRSAVAAALDSWKPVLGTIQDRRNSFLDGVRERGDVEIIRVDADNRDPLVAVVADAVRRLLAHRGVSDGR